MTIGRVDKTNYAYWEMREWEILVRKKDSAGDRVGGIMVYDRINS